MRSFFGAVTALSLRFRWITLIIAGLVSVAGISAIMSLRQELIPAVEFPQTIILAQVSGMTSDQVLGVITERIEQTLDEQVPEIVNLESSTTGTFGAVVTARNDFGQNQARLQRDIQAALDTIWLPTRQISAPEGTAPEAFASSLLADLSPEVLIYLAEQDPAFLFQLTPDVWSALSDETATAVLAYLASSTQAQSGAGGALRQLVDQEIVPLLDNLTEVASVSVGGGQTLPGEGGEAETTAAPQTTSLLLKLSPEVWAVAAEKAGYSGALDQQAAEALAANAPAVPETAPALPASWQMDRFSTAEDLVEMRTLTRTVGALLNDFATSGRIVGSLGQTDDLTPEVVAQMLALDPSLVNYFKAEHLAAMSPEVFAALPEDFIAGLDGFTRDELAARGLAAAISGEDAAPDPVDLPAPWRISPPQIITFSFDDLPLATWAISGSVEGAANQATDSTDTTAPSETVAEATPEPTAAPVIAEGPSLPLPFTLLGTFLGTELNSADDLITVELSPDLASQLGQTSISGGAMLGFLMQMGNAENLPEGVQAPSLPIDPAAIIGLISADAVQFLVDNDPTFLTSLSADVFNAFSDDVLALDAVAPPLDSVWNTLAGQPQFANAPLRNAADLVALGNGTPSAALNAINAGVPEQFAGYEVRLFNSLTPATLRYLALRETGFYTAVSPEVLLKLSPTTLATLPEEALAALPADTAAQLQAIAAGETPSAAEALAALYATDVPAADPNAPALNADWQFIGDFIGVELDTADDFTRFFPDTTNFLNSLFDSAGGASFAPRLFGNISADALLYMIDQTPALVSDLRNEALALLPAEVMAAMPAAMQERAASGEAPFKATDSITRTDGASSLLLTIYKSSDANTVQAYHTANDSLQAFLDDHPGLSVAVAFEQASFIEESISGVAREGGLGAIFAIIVILIFLSAGIWNRQARFLVGGILTAVMVVGLLLIVNNTAASFGGNFQAGWDNTDVLVRGLLLLGALFGLFIMLWPTNVARPAWRSTLVTAISIPLSILMAFMLMSLMPPAVNSVLAPAAEGSPILSFLLRLFPSSITVNIMTLSGLTVAIGRVVDDSIVVLENIFRQVSEGGDKRTAIINGTKEVSVAIFAATIITVVVFLPLGLTGGIIGEFFLPFGLAVTYSLLSSFVVAITVVPVLAYLLLNQSEMDEEGHEGRLERIYNPALRWSLSKRGHRFGVLGIAFASLIIGMALFAGRPTAFLPSFGEPQISVAVNLPSGTSILDTNAAVAAFEAALAERFGEEIERVQTTVGSSGFSIQSLLLGGSSVEENVAAVTVAVDNPARLDALTGEIRSLAQETFGEENATVSAASLSEQGFGGFALVLSGPQEDLEAVNQQVIDALNQVDGLANASSNLAGPAGASGGSGEDTPTTYIRIDGESAVRYTGELETENTLGVTAAAKTAIMNLEGLPATIKVSEGFESSLQTQGFANLFVAMGIAIVIVIIILIITFGSLVHWIDIMLSVIVAPVGAAIALALTNRVLGISAMIGMLMLIGIVVTNAVVLIDRVRTNQFQRKMEVTDALEEAGHRRLRPILMTAIATIFALMPLAIGLSQGAIIASELGTVVIGGLFSSTLLTLIVVPVAYKMLDPLDRRTRRWFRRGKADA